MGKNNRQKVHQLCEMCTFFAGIDMSNTLINMSSSVVCISFVFFLVILYNVEISLCIRGKNGGAKNWQSHVRCDLVISSSATSSFASYTRYINKSSTGNRHEKFTKQFQITNLLAHIMIFTNCNCHAILDKCY